MNLTNFKENLLQSKLWPLIKTEDTIAVFLVGSQLYPRITDTHSDIDIMCLTTRKRDWEYWPLYSFEYEGRHGHWAYWQLEEALLYKVPLDISAERWHHNQGIQQFLTLGDIIWIRDDYKWILDFLKKHAKERLIISSYVSFNYTWTPAHLTAENYYWPKEKTAWAVLFSSYLLQNKEPNWDLILKSKRSSFPSTETFLTSQEEQERKEQILWLRDFILQHPVNIPQMMIELQAQFTQKLMEVNGIEPYKFNF